MVVATLLATLVGAVGPVRPASANVPPGGQTARECFVEQAHVTFLDRSATPTELATRSQALANGTPRYVLVTDLAESEEWLGVTVRDIYQLALDRDPEPAGLAYWVAELRGGALVNRIGAQIFGSTEFYNRAGGTSSEFVGALYGLILERLPSNADIAYWTGEVASRGRGGVAGAFYASIESRNRRVNGLYDALLDRAPSPADLVYWADRLSTENDVRLAILIASSAEFETLSRAGCAFELDLVTDDLPGATAGVAYQTDLVATGGQTPYSWTASGLPTGLTVAGQQIVGTTNAAGTVTVMLMVTDAEGTQETRSVDVFVTNASPSEVDMGGFHTCSVSRDGTVRCWGFNTSGQLGFVGNGSNTPLRLTTIGGASDVAAGGDFSCAVTRGSVQCWGADASGQLGNGSSPGSAVPSPVTGITDATAAEAGSQFACALRTSGGVSCWGANTHGQLGNGTTTSSTVPVVVSGLTDATEISVGEQTACARRRGGTVVCWGRGSGGRLGNGNGVDSSTTVTVTGLTDARSVSVGWSHACALLQTGGVRCWGDNTRGQIGDGTTTLRTTPVTPTGLGSAVAITAGNSVTCAIESGGAVKCWGWAERGALGLGDDPEPPVSVPTPTAVPGLSGITAIEMGDRSGFATSNTGVLRAWGVNGAGQLGVGNSANIYDPTIVTL